MKIFVHNYTSEIVEIHAIENPKKHPRLKTVKDLDDYKKFKVKDPVKFGHNSEPDFLESHDDKSFYEDSNGRLMQYTNDYTSVEEYVSRCYNNTFEYSIDDTSDDPQEMVTLCHAKALLAAGSCIPRLVELNSVIKETVDKCTELIKEKHKQQ